MTFWILVNLIHWFFTWICIIWNYNTGFFNWLFAFIWNDSVLWFFINQHAFVIFTNLTYFFINIFNIILHLKFIIYIINFFWNILNIFLHLRFFTNDLTLFHYSIFLLGSKNIILIINLGDRNILHFWSLIIFIIHENNFFRVLDFFKIWCDFCVLTNSGPSQIRKI